PPGLLAERDDLLKDRVAMEMKRFFGHDFKRIGHAANVARYAEQIVKEEKGNPAVVLSAAYLHDIGIPEAARKYDSTAARYHQKEGPPIAREILTKLGAREEIIDEVCDIIGHHHHPRDKETMNFKILYDADLIVNLEEGQKKKETERDIACTVILDTENNS
ncbi:MAG: HD domain-containing protein, partial [Deltaproteobacteria bacterium]|nr:HD domain-containing protein [Deltaproteobacteria bacterium]